MRSFIIQKKICHFLCLIPFQSPNQGRQGAAVTKCEFRLIGSTDIHKSQENAENTHNGKNTFPKDQRDVSIF